MTSDGSQRDAFCETCPPALEVTQALERLGFRVRFQMDGVTYPKLTHIPDLPAQYHYVDPYGTEIIYLAGRDTPEEGGHYPAHASRFWLWPGSQPEACQRAASLLSTIYRVRWHNSARLTQLV